MAPYTTLPIYIGWSKVLSHMPRQKEQVTITLPPEVLQWLDGKVADRTFANRSHGIEVAVRNLMQIKNEERKPR